MRPNVELSGPTAALSPEGPAQRLANRRRRLYRLRPC